MIKKKKMRGRRHSNQNMFLKHFSTFATLKKTYLTTKFTNASVYQCFQNLIWGIVSKLLKKDRNATAWTLSHARAGLILTSHRARH